jgi:hypothetical protein
VGRGALLSSPGAAAGTVGCGRVPSGMELSAEMRWFWPGTSNDAVFRALAERLGFGPAQTRTDHYLSFPVPELGVKLREGRLEIQQRVGSRADTNWQGVIEHWAKWGADAAPENLRGNGTWRTVRKSRRLLVLVPGGSGLVVAPAGADPGEGCNVELTELEMDGTRAWSLGFEAYGTLGREQLLESALQRHASDLSSIKVSIAQSMGYPAWLMGATG